MYSEKLKHYKCNNDFYEEGGIYGVGTNHGNTVRKGVIYTNPDNLQKNTLLEAVIPSAEHLQYCDSYNVLFTCVTLKEINIRT